MTPSDVAALTLSILAGLAAVISALVALVTAFRNGAAISSVSRDINGRVDQLLAEREERVRLALQLDAQERVKHNLPPPPAVGRGEPTIRRFPDEPQNKGEE